MFKICPSYYDELERAVGDCASLLDVGCGSNSAIKRIPKRAYSVGVDMFAPDLQKSREQNIHDEYHVMNVMDIEKKFKPGSFECVVALDLIEHLDKNDGLRLISMLEKIAMKKVVIFTPNGFLPQKEDGNPYQLHRSGWTCKELSVLGCEVIGVNGFKLIRGEYAAPRFRPKRLWEFIAQLSQFYVRDHPRLAFQILCVKDNPAR